MFFHDNIFGLFFGKLLGLLTGLSIASMVNILIFTQKSSEPLPAYRRYLATIFHMCIWYDNDFQPGSKAWKSIAYVKNLHNSASKRSCAAGFKGITQLDMALTQFAFMGFSIIRPEQIGIHNAKKEDVEAFIHVWRVIGYIMGMEDRYNICTDSFEETKEICEFLLENVVAIEVRKQEATFLHMADVLVNGMWVTNPMLETKVFLSYAYKLIYSNTKSNDTPQIKLNRLQKFRLNMISSWMAWQKYDLFRICNKWFQFFCLWLLKNCPFLAYYSFGYKNSHVMISLPNRSNNSG